MIHSTRPIVQNAIERFAINDEFPNEAGTYALVRRPNGNVEKVTLSRKFFGMHDWLAKKIKADTLKFGSEVLKLVTKDWKTNESELIKKYRNGFLEGGDGYIPDMSRSPKFKRWLEVKEW